METPKIKISIVMPMHNEQECVENVHQELTQVMNANPWVWEAVYVDDGSTDRTRELLRALAGKNQNVRAVCLNRNYGQAIATMAGADSARGEIVIVMDGDGQYDPKDIVNLVAKMEEGYDVVSGWRADRGDQLITRRLPSLVANRMLKKVSKLDLRDFGSSFKAYRRNLLNKIRLSDGLHRFVPILAAQHTKRIVEIPIHWRNRKAGTSKYGLGRTSAVLFDIFTAWFLTHYGHAPLRLLGKLGLSLTVPSLLGIAVMFLLWVFAGMDMNEHRGTLTLLVFFGILGIQFFCTGFVGELLAQVSRESRQKEAYLVFETIENTTDRTHAPSLVRTN